MKKRFLAFLAAMLIIGLTACDDEANVATTEESDLVGEDNALANDLIGAWQDERYDDRFQVFMADGTAFRDGSGRSARSSTLVYPSYWEIVGDQLIMESAYTGHRSQDMEAAYAVVVYDIVIEGDMLILSRIREAQGRLPRVEIERTYTRVSDDAEVESIIARQTAYREGREIELAEQPSALEFFLINEIMEEFEQEYAISSEQARYLAFSPFLMMSNFESPHVFQINCMLGGTDCAADILADFWNITDEGAALRNLESLSSANGQRGIADDIWGLIQNGQTSLLDPEVGFDLTGLDHVSASASNQVNEMIDMLLEDDEQVDQLLLMMALDGIDIEGDWQEVLYDELIMFAVSDRVNAGLVAFERASAMLIEDFDFTEEELLEIKTLAAWDYGRVSIIARYGVAAGFLDETVAWEHLQLAAENAVESYSNWREYTAAHILGRAIAFGNDSRDMREVLEFLFDHDESPFERHEFNLNE